MLDIGQGLGASCGKNEDDIWLFVKGFQNKDREKEISEKKTGGKGK